jgi:putative protease
MVPLKGTLVFGLEPQSPEVVMPEEQIGIVTHYFGGPQVAVVKLEAGELALGDRLRFKGHTTDFTEEVTSMEVNHQKIERAKAGDEVAIKVSSRVRRHDQVFKVT